MTVSFFDKLIQSRLQFNTPHTSTDTTPGITSTSNHLGYIITYSAFQVLLAVFRVAGFSE